MANVTSPNTVSFSNPAALVAPDVAAEQLALQRRQQIVDMLKQQALAQDQQQVVTGAGPARVVPVSPLQGVTKMLTAYLAGKGQKDLDAKNLDLSRQYAQRMAQILGGTASPETAAPAALGMGAAQGSVGPTTANAQRMDAMTQGSGQAPGQRGFDMASLLRGQVIGQVGGDGAASAYWDQFKLPEGVKTNNYYGIGAADVAPAMRRKLAAEGQTVLQPGGSIAQPGADGVPRIQLTAPDLKQGANITWQNGSPVATEIPGLREINAGMAGAAAAATAGAQAGYDMVTVNTPNRPVMMTRAQAVQQAGGPRPAPAPASPAPAPAGMPSPGGNPFANLPKPEAGVNGNFEGDPAAVIASIAAMKDPQERANAYAAFADQMRMNGGTLPQKAAGIPLQTEGQSQFEKTMGGQQGEILRKSYDNANTAAEDLLGVGESRKALAGGAFTGTGADLKLTLTKFINANVPGVTIAPDKAANTDYLKSQLGQALLEKAKTLGSNPSNADAARINDIVGSIGKDPNALAKILDWREAMAQRAIALHNQKVQQSIGNGFKPQFDMTVKVPSGPNPAKGFRIIGVQ